MKRSLLLLLLLLPFCAAAQTPTFGEFYEDYAGQDGYRTIELGHKMMQMMGRDADPQLAQLLDGIRRIRIIATKRPAPFFWARAHKIASEGDYSLISHTDEADRSTSFYFIDGGSEGLSELLMLAGDKKELVVLNIYGRFDVRDISRLTRLNIRPEQTPEQTSEQTRKQTKKQSPKEKDEEK